MPFFYKTNNSKNATNVLQGLIIQDAVYAAIWRVATTFERST